MSILLIRTDDRFIHGQVTTGWARQMGIDHIALVNDGIAKNSIIMKLQQASAGQNILVEFFSIEQAIASIKKGEFCTRGKYFLLIENPVDLLELVKAGLTVNEVNLGNLHFEPGRKKVTNWVFASPGHLEALKELDSMGVKLTAQWVVASDAVDVNHWLKKNT